MFELIDIHPDSNVQESEYKRLLGFPLDYVLEGRSRELADQSRQWYAQNGRPWIYARQIEGLELGCGRVRIDGAVFSSRQLHDNFSAAQAQSAMLAAFSAGGECEEKSRQLWQEGKPDEYFFMEMFGSAVVEHLVAVASGRICGWADGQGMAALQHYSPGYSSWDMADQPKLWEIIRKTDGGDCPGELRVMDSGMLRPKKSLLALFGLTRHLDKVKTWLVPCENCSLAGCQYRRAPHLHSLPELENARQLASDPSTRTTSPSGLRHDAKYSVNLKALRKWSRERLQLSARPDGSIEAHFRYEGATCSNLGWPLEYDYHILLGPAREGHRIVEAACLPAPGDTGHALQCEHLKDAASFMHSIDSKKPLLGAPLNDVLAWQRPFSPSGCFCDADRRAHKWGLVFEVIHYALVQREKE
ncbi:MAG: hypothetical protein ABSA83_16310 [Verrucomicrobiota bacterium]|jgi:hypothetical protein